MINHDYFTCEELIRKHPITKLWGWNQSKIGVFYASLLLDGRKFGKKSRLMVTEVSFRNLKEYVHESNLLEDCCETYLSYDEILEVIPQATSYRWTPTVIGIFLHSKLLYGKKSSGESRNLIKMSSADNLIDFTGQRFEEIRQRKQ